MSCTVCNKLPNFVPRCHQLKRGFWIGLSRMYLQARCSFLWFATYWYSSCYRWSLSSMLYRVLARAEVLNAFLDGIHVIPIEIGKDSFFTNNFATCKILLFMSYWLRTTVALVLVNIILERMKAVVFPHRAKALNTRRRYAWQFLGISIVFFVIYEPISNVVEYTILHHIEGEPRLGHMLWMGFHSKLGWYVKDVNIWMNMIMSSLLQFVIIITIHFVIIYGLVKSHRLSASSARANPYLVPLNSQIAILMSISFDFVITSRTL